MSGHIDPHSPLIPAQEMVLPTLQGDGKRRWINPALATGKYWQRRRLLAYGLIAFFVTLPHLRLWGKPIVLLDIVSREFTFFGHTFYPTDSGLLLLLLLTLFFSIMFITAVGGRLWCGWGCPQTVYLEFLFRPIDRLFAGTVGKGGKPRKSLATALQMGRFAVYLACSMFLAHTFLSYFIGTDRLAQWMRLYPWQHPTAFGIMAGATAGLMYNFMFFREQLCMVACPYGRFQSVMLDKRSLIVTYDIHRGEPRHKGKALVGSKAGDCIDCGHCTAVCPTGIDIRNGLQMECIHCTQCIDACDAVMGRIGKPEGLIRYSSQDALSGVKHTWIRARTLIYPVLALVTSTLFLMLLTTKFAFDARILSTPGAPYSVTSTRDLQNNFRLRLRNRSNQEETYSIQMLTPGGASVRWSDTAPTLKPNESKLVPIMITAPLGITAANHGSVNATVKISDESGHSREIPIRILGPG
ncbi:MAG: cytochrome c oxidase accessory protein CcoG [Planctomycetaceae bacterium]|jgi:cytochrome c oxidase accessory protein FixG|nr:cytochrome c oxidase accessory protein CcoG [Planctomycetaceae bacterium]MCE2811570.1 cytochrome c oxidase accessory protein CcoG [Planctomycetaceae bacterium]